MKDQTTVNRIKSKPFWALLLHYVRCNFRNIFLPVHWGNCLFASERIPTGNTCDNMQKR